MASKAKGTKKKPRVTDVAADLTDGLDDDAEPLALHIDEDLGSSVWNGTRFEDRVIYADGTLHRDLVTEIERSLMAQENYDEFEARWLKSLGLSTAEPAGALRDLETRLLNETRVAWNEAMVSANAEQGETILVSESRLLPTTTVGCAAKHGIRLDDIPDSIPYHWGCVAPETHLQGSFVMGFRQLYFGDVCELKTGKGYRLTVTPNHPVATAGGFVPAGLLQKGMQLITYCRNVEEVSASPAFMAKQVQNPPPLAHEVFEALFRMGGLLARFHTADDDFHSDAQRGNGHVDIVASDRILLRDLISQVGNYCSHFALKPMYRPKAIHPSSCLAQPQLKRYVSTARSLPSRAQLALDCLAVMLRRFPAHLLRDRFGSNGNPILLKTLNQSDPANPSNGCEHEHGLAPLVSRYDARKVGYAFASAMPRGNFFGCRQIRFGNAPAMPNDLDATLRELVPELRHGTAETIRQVLQAQSSMLQLDNLVEINVINYRGSVHDFRSTTGAMVADNIVISNCYCQPRTIPNPDSDDPEIAAAGQAILDEMAAERAAWGASDADLMTEANRKGGEASL